jgi:hypothetical protein
VSDDGALFDLDPSMIAEPAPEPAPTEKLSPDRRRTMRHAEMIAAGAHPLGAGVYRHPATTGELYAAGDQRARPHTCGSCRFRELFGAGNRTVPKCTYGDGMPRATHSAASDVRGWWPACRDYTAGDPGMSPDAARHIPEDIR